MGHYRSNLRDIEFNLFELLKVQDYLDAPAFKGLDSDTASDMLTEIERLASNEWAASFTAADRASIDLAAGEVRLPPELKASVAALRSGGWERMGLPDELGGIPITRTLFWAAQELLLGANPTATFYVSGALFARVLFEEGTEEQKALARLMVDRGWAGTMVLTEPDAGSDVGAGTTKAVEVEEGIFHLTGVKRFITGGEHDATDNIIHLVLARPEGAGLGTKGLSLFVVPKFLVNPDGSLGDRNGVIATHLEKKMGLKGSTTCELTFGDERPAVGYLVGGIHDGIRQMFRVIEYARMLIGTKSTATLSTGYLNALAYSRDRLQGADLAEFADKASPRVAIIRHPDVRRMLMIQKAHVEGLRALYLYTAWVQDQVMLNPINDGLARRAELLFPIVKGYSSEKAYELLALSLQVLGGAGFTQDHPIEQYIRDAKIDSIYEGTTSIQALDLFFRKIARDQGVTIAALAAEIQEFVKAGPDGDPLAPEREILGEMLDDAQAHLGVMVSHLVASLGGRREEIYSTALHANALLESLAEVVMAWLLVRQGEIAAAKIDTDDFYVGKLAASRFFVRHVAPKVKARRGAAETEDGWLMNLPDRAF